jgi:hypothetical protein
MPILRIHKIERRVEKAEIEALIVRGFIGKFERIQT